MHRLKFQAMHPDTLSVNSAQSCGPSVFNAFCTKACALSFNVEFVPCTTHCEPEKITTVTPLSTPPVVPLLGMPSKVADSTDASPSSRESPPGGPCVSPNTAPMHLPL